MIDDDDDDDGDDDDDAGFMESRMLLFIWWWLVSYWRRCLWERLWRKTMMVLWWQSTKALLLISNIQLLHSTFGLFLHWFHYFFHTVGLTAARRPWHNEGFIFSSTLGLTTVGRLWHNMTIWKMFFSSVPCIYVYHCLYYATPCFVVFVLCSHVSLPMETYVTLAMIMWLW